MSTATHDHHGEHEHHITPPSKLTVNLFILGVLMGLTILAAQVDFGHIISNMIGGSSALGSYINNFIALGIAIAKAYFVVSIFMGVKWGTPLIKLWAMTGFVWMTLLFITFGDYGSRNWENNKGWTPGSSDLTAFPSQMDDRKRENQIRLAEEAEKKGGGH